MAIRGRPAASSLPCVIPLRQLLMSDHSFAAAVGFEKHSKWMWTASEDGTVKVWDVRARGCQREYESRAPVNCAVLHPNQGELISGALSESCSLSRSTLSDVRAAYCRCGRVGQPRSAALQTGRPDALAGSTHANIWEQSMDMASCSRMGCKPPIADRVQQQSGQHSRH